MTSNASFSVSGMSCNSCVAKVQNKLNGLAGIQNAKVTLAPPQAELNYDGNADLAGLNNVMSGMGYLLSPLESSRKKNILSEETASKGSFKPLIIILAYLLLATLISQYMSGWDGRVAMRNFMGGFFLVFSFFKMLDLRGFAESYSMYDILAGKWMGWGYLYPFIELSLGIAYLIDFSPLVTNLITLVVMSISSIGVIRAVIDKKKIQCACLGTGFNLPMTTVTIIEDLTMVAMAVFMLIA